MGRRALPRGPFSQALISAIKAEMAISQAELARRLGVDEETVSRWMRGHTVMNVDNLAQIASVIGRKPSDLVYRAQEILLMETLGESDAEGTVLRAAKGPDSEEADLIDGA